MADPKNPPSFKDALVDASQAIAGGVGAADYDEVFAGHMLKAIGQFIRNPPKAQGQPPAGGAQPPAGGAPGQPVPDGSGGDAGPPTGAPAAGGQPGPGGSGPPGGGAQTPPGAPTPGGMTQGLTPSPDEMRRVLSDVAGK